MLDVRLDLLSEHFVVSGVVLGAVVPLTIHLHY